MPQIPTKEKKGIIEHFRGIDDTPEPTRQGEFDGYVGRSLNLIDLVGGNLCKIGGAISATSNPSASIRSLAQLRFREHTYFLVHSDHYTVYEPTPNPYPNGGDKEPVIKWDVTRPPKRKRWHPSECHSYWELLLGRWYLPVDDLEICYRARGETYSQSYGISGTACDAVEAGYSYYSEHRGEAAWGPWARRVANDPLISMPYFRVQAKWSPVIPLGWAWGISWQEVQYSPRSDLLANPPVAPTGGEYDSGFLSISGGIAGLNLDNVVGNSDAAKAVACGTGTVSSAQASVSHFSLKEAKGKAKDKYTITSCEDIPKDGNWHWTFGYVPGYEPAKTFLWLMAEGGKFVTHDSCFEV